MKNPNVAIEAKRILFPAIVGTGSLLACLALTETAFVMQDLVAYLTCIALAAVSVAIALVTTRMSLPNKPDAKSLLVFLVAGAIGVVIQTVTHMLPQPSTIIEGFSSGLNQGLVTAVFAIGTLARLISAPALMTMAGLFATDKRWKVAIPAGAISVLLTQTPLETVMCIVYPLLVVHERNMRAKLRNQED